MHLNFDKYNTRRNCKSFIKITKPYVKWEYEQPQFITILLPVTSNCTLCNFQYKYVIQSCVIGVKFLSSRKARSKHGIHWELQQKTAASWSQFSIKWPCRSLCILCHLLSGSETKKTCPIYSLSYNKNTVGYAGTNVIGSRTSFVIASVCSSIW